MSAKDGSLNGEVMRPGTLARWQALQYILRKEINEGARVLDVGGFDGYIPYRLKKRYRKLSVFIADIEKEGLASAQKRGLYAMCASGRSLPAKDASFDIVFSLSVIEHVDDAHKLIKEIARVIKPGGTLILSTPGQNGITFPFFNKEKNAALQKDWGHLRLGYALDELVTLLSAHKLSVVRHQRYFNGITRFFYRFCLLSRFHIPGAAAVFRCVVCLEPYVKWGGQAHVVIAHKQEP